MRALLLHLHHVGFDAVAPDEPPLTPANGDRTRFVAWSDEAIHDLGLLLRRLHTATASFRPPTEARWRLWFGRDVGAPTVIGHCDVAPWNVVARHGRPVALANWETSGPVDHLTEIAIAAWMNAALVDDEVAEMNGLPDARARLRQMRVFADGYSLSARDRHRLRLPDRIIEVAARSAAHEVIEQRMTPLTTTAPRLWEVAWRARSAGWLFKHRRALTAVLA